MIFADDKSKRQRVRMMVLIKYIRGESVYQVRGIAEGVIPRRRVSFVLSPKTSGECGGG